MLKKLQILILILGISSTAKLPSNFQKCNRNQPNLELCTLKAAQDGISKVGILLKELHLPEINPFEVSKIEIEGKGSVSVTQNYYNCKLYGFHLINFEQFEFDFVGKTLHIKGVFPEIKHLCQYKFDGQILLFRVKGSGPSKIILNNLHVDLLLNFEEVNQKNKTYLKFVSSDLDMNPEFIEFNFENVFNGDKALSDNINKVINENWKEVFEDMKSGHIQIINKILINIFNNLFSKLSLEEALD